MSHSGDMSSGHYVAYVRARPQMETYVTHLFNDNLNFNIENMTSVLTEKCKGLSLNDTELINEEKTSLEPKKPSVNEIFELLEKNSKWYYASDSSVVLVSEKQVLSAEAYILFYERIF